MTINVFSFSSRGNGIHRCLPYQNACVSLNSKFGFFKKSQFSCFITERPRHIPGKYVRNVVMSFGAGNITDVYFNDVYI